MSSVLYLTRESEEEKKKSEPLNKSSNRGKKGEKKEGRKRTGHHPFRNENPLLGKEGRARYGRGLHSGVLRTSTKGRGRVEEWTI